MTDISELFARDPLQLGQQDIDAIIARMRAARHQFNLGNPSAGKMKPNPKVDALNDKAKQLGLDIDL